VDDKYDVMIDMPLTKMQNQLYKKEHIVRDHIEGNKISPYIGALMESQALNYIVSTIIHRRPGSLLNNILCLPKDSYFHFSKLFSSTMMRSSRHFKWFELVRLCYMSSRYNLFTITNVSQACPGSDRPHLPKKFFKPDTISSTEIRRLTNREFDSFLGNIETADVIASPINKDAYPGVGVVRHFKYQTARKSVYYITVFVQSIHSFSHTDRNEDSLNEMISIVKAGAEKLRIKNHRIEFWWLIPESNETFESPWPYLKQIGIHERRVSFDHHSAH